MARKANGFFPIIFLTLVVFISVVALTLTNIVTQERIEVAKREAIKEMLGALFPEMEDFAYDEESGLYTVLMGSEPLGQAFMAEGAGYGGTIAILVGLEQDHSVRGIQIISHQETPGLGAKISEPSFLEQFKGINLNEIALARDGGKIDAITGATISSSAVVKGVKEAILKKMHALGEEEERK